jgi:nucleoside-diphosphate-sugar epimerase
VSSNDKPAIVVTGIAGNLGTRLLPMLGDFNVIGVDMVPPRTDLPLRYENIDLGRESACRQLVQIVKKYNVRAVVHLAFVVDPLRTGVLDVDHMWQINVAGTARVMEAITEVNRHDGAVDTFLFPSSISAYGPNTPGPVKETHPLAAHTLPYAIHKMEADNVVRFRAESMGDCATYVLRPPIFAGASVQNYMVGALRGIPTGRGKRAERMRQQGKQVPLLTPGKAYRQNRFQFVHVDDVARLIAYILRRPAPGKFDLTVLNVAGRGEPLTFEEVSAIANSRVKQVPGKWMMREILSLMWSFGVSGIPPEAAPYMYGSYLVDSTRLKQFLGKDYESVIRYSIATALQDTFKTDQQATIAAHNS